MNIMPFFHFFCLIFYIHMAVSILARNPKSLLNKVCAVLFGSFALWSVGSIFIHNRAVSKTTALLFENITAPFWIGFGSLFLWCALLVVKRGKIFQRRFLYPLLLVPVLLLVYMQWSGSLVVDYIAKNYGWALVWSGSAWPFLYYFYLALFLGAGQWVIFKGWRRSGDVFRKKQLKVIFVTCSVTFLIGFFSDIILPRLGIYVIPDLADVSATIAAAGLIYIMVKYKFLTITPSRAAENIMSRMSELLILLDAGGNIVKTNKAALDLSGFSERDLKGKPVGILFNELPASICKKMLQGEEIDNLEVNLKTRGGIHIPVLFSCSTLKNDAGTVIGLVCILRDISELKIMEKKLEGSEELKRINEQLQLEINERKAAEQLLRASKEKYQALTENINMGIFRGAAGKKGEFLEGNPAAVDMFGCLDRADFLNASFSQFFRDKQDVELFHRKMTKYGFVRNEELKLENKEGTPFTGCISAVAVKENRGKAQYYDCIIEDITQRKQLEAQLMQAKKMEAVGRLSGGIAHEFNNMLAAIIGFVELSKMRVEPDSKVSHYLERVLKTSGAARDLIRQLLAFSRKALIQPKVINLNRLLQNNEEVLRRLLGENIQLDFEPARELGNVKADPGQLEQILLNLAVNSKDAMPEGGTLSIKTSKVEVGKTLISRYPYMKAGPYVLMSVADTGCGISGESLAHMFEPFFTTKRKSGSAGLGLSTVYGIVKQNDGFINIGSRVDQGTTVDIYLPEVAEKAESSQPRLAESKLVFGAEMILVVEDEESVRETTVEILTACGYNVTSARDGEETLDVWKKYNGQFDLLLTDVVLPTISGYQLSKTLLELKPGLKVLYMSGYPEDMISQHGIVDGDISLLSKPFSSAQLTERIRELLDAGEN